MITFEADGRVAATPDAVRAVVADLSTYPRWLRIVQRAEPAPGGGWLVDVGTRVGPLRLAKRLRMVEVPAERAADVVFERREDDGAEHAAWVMRASLAPDGPGTRLAFRLRYDGGLSLPGLDRVLRAEATQAVARLNRLVVREAN